MPPTVADSNVRSTALVEPRAPTRALPLAAQAPLVRHPVWVGIPAAGFAVAAYVTYPSGPKALIAAILAATLVVVAVTDLERRVIPNRVVLPAIGLLLALRIGFYPAHSPEYIAAAILVGLLLLLPNFVNSSAIGMGDVKLGVLLGAGLGWTAFDAVAVGFVLLFPLAIATLVRGGMAARKAALPLGPFLACGGMLVLIIPQLFGLKAG